VLELKRGVRADNGSVSAISACAKQFPRMQVERGAAVLAANFRDDIGHFVAT